MTTDLSKVVLSPEQATNFESQVSSIQNNINTLKANKATGTSATPSTPITPVTAPNSSPNVPSSSATSTLTANSMNTTSGVTNPPPVNNPALSEAQQWYMKQYGLTEDDVRGISGTTEGRSEIGSAYSDYQSYQQGVGAQNESFQADQLKNDADYQASLTKINNLETSAVGSVKQAIAAGSPDSVGPQTALVTSRVQQTYETLRTQAKATYLAAKAAAQAGNDKAAAQLLSDFHDQIEKVKTDTATIVNNNATQQRQKTALEQNDQAKAVTAFQNALTNPSITSDQSDALSKLPSDWNAMTPAQQQQATSIVGGLSTLAQKTGNYNDANGNFDPAQAWTSIQGGLTNSVKQQQTNIAQTRANISLTLEQLKLTQDQDAMIQSQTIAGTPNGTAYLSALQAAQANGNYSTSKNKATVSALNDAITSGNFSQAQTIVTNYALSGGGSNSFAGALDSLRTVSSATTKLMNDIKALPPGVYNPGFFSGNMQDVAAKLGQNPNPQLQLIGQELAHMGAIYGRAVGGVRGASSTNSVFSSLLPNIKDTKSLQLSDLQAFVNTSNDLLNSQVSGTIGQDNFNAIYGSGGVLGTSKGGNSNSGGLTIGTQTFQAGQSFKTSDGKTFIVQQGANGKLQAVPAQ